jgi:hypothetical protein
MSIDEENGFGKIQHPFIIKAQKKEELEGKYFQIKGYI